MKVTIWIASEKIMQESMTVLLKANRAKALDILIRNQKSREMRA